MAELESGDLHEVRDMRLRRHHQLQKRKRFGLRRFLVARKMNENLLFSEAGKEPTNIPMAMATRSVSHFGATMMQ